MIPCPPPEVAQLYLQPFLSWEAITLVPELALSPAAEPGSSNQCPEGLLVRNGFTTELSSLSPPRPRHCPPLLLPLKTVWTLMPCLESSRE